jgi:RNase adapter protein RapZ
MSSATSTAEAKPASNSTDLVLLTGISGSGKSVALHALEDAGYFCVDNLPPELLRELVRVESERFTQKLAAAIDVRTATSLPALRPLADELRAEGHHVRIVFLDASTEALVRRFSETRRPHPLRGLEPSAEDAGAEPARALEEAIALERTLLTDLREVATVVDTSQLRPAQLRTWIRELVGAGGSSLTVVIESFAFKRGVPLDADFVFDVRVLPNPFYTPMLRPLTGRDAPVAQFLAAQPEVGEMLAQIEAFLLRWLPAFEDDQRSYLTVAIGCTGGQHRSVYLAEQLALRLRSRHSSLLRHRELGARE